MVIPKVYVRVTRKLILSSLLSLSVILSLSSYYHHRSVPSTHSPSMFFSPSSSLSHHEINFHEFPVNGFENTQNRNVNENKVGFITKKKITDVQNTNLPKKKNYKTTLKVNEKNKQIFERHFVSPSVVMHKEKDLFNNNHLFDVINYPVAKGITQNYTDISPRQYIPLHSGRSSVSIHTLTNSTTKDKTQEKFKHRYNKIINKTRKSKASWHYDTECQKFRVYFAKMGVLPLCALASYPGSGNTWTRRLLEDASGIFTGSIYSDQQLFVNGYYGELEPWTSGTTIAQKTHDCGPYHIEAFNKSAILLLRNPYRAILSFHNYLFAGHTGFAPMSNYKRKDWGKFVHLQAKSWLEMAINWTTQSDPQSLTVLHYEHLQKDPVPHLERALKNLGFQPDPARMKCLEKAHSYKTFKRKEEYVPENLQMFSTADRDKIDRAIRYVDYLLRKRGQPPLPSHLYEFYNGTSSSHITRVPCLKTESEAQCDQRVDTLNNVREKKESQHFNNKTQTEKEITEITEIKQRRKNRLDKFVNTKMGNMLTNMFVSIASSLKQDPIDLIFREESTLRLQLRSLHLEAKDYPEAQQLMRDFKAGIL